jgi:hypothetical protein
MSWNFRYAKEKKDHYQYIKERDGKWVILQKGAGKVLSHHDTREKAISSFKAMMAHKHGSSAQLVRHPSSLTPFGYQFYPNEEEHQVMRAPAATPPSDGGCICKDGFFYNNCPVHGSNRGNDHFTIHNDWRDENSNLNSDW